MKKTYEYRAYPTAKQADKLVAWLEILRNLYNQALAWRKETCEQTGQSVKKSTQEKALTPFRQESDTVASLHIDVLQDTIDRLDKAYQAFFRRGKKGNKPGFPRFKGAGRYRSMTFKHLAKQLVCAIGKRTARVVVPKIGHVKIHYHRPLPDGKIKTLTIRRKASGWYVCIVVEILAPVEIPVETTIGIDVGLASFLTTSNGDKVDNPRHFRRSEKRLGKAQRTLSRCERGSVRYEKQREHVAKIHEHISNQRRDFQDKIAHWLFCQCEEVAVEDLKIKNMVKNKHLSKSISDAGWGSFRLRLQSKAARSAKRESRQVGTGLTLTQVDPKHTSQKCSGCDSVVPKSLSERIHTCLHCGLILDRDYNAAINIKKAAVALRVPILGIPICRERCVGSQRPRTPPSGDRSAELGKTHWADKQTPSFRAG